MSAVLVMRVAAGLFVAIALIVAQILVVRMANASRRHRRQALERTWLPLLVRSLDEAPAELPAIHRRDVQAFLDIWNRVHDSIEGDFEEALHGIARATKADAAARMLFATGGLRERLLAIATLGRLRDPALWNELVRLAIDRDLALSLAAARALVRIDARAALPLLLPVVARRDDWPVATVVAILHEAGHDALSAPLAEAIAGTPPGNRHRLVRFLGLVDSDASVRIVRQLIRQAHTVENITACLRVFGDADDLEAVYPFLHHPRWEVRVRAIDVVARLGTSSDAPRLEVLLSDFEWWVRYRAAEALCALLSTDIEPVRHLRATSSDPFARDILAHVLAEREAA